MLARAASTAAERHAGDHPASAACSISSVAIEWQGSSTFKVVCCPRPVSAEGECAPVGAPPTGVGVGARAREGEFKTCESSPGMASGGKLRNGLNSGMNTSEARKNEQVPSLCSHVVASASLPSSSLSLVSSGLSTSLVALVVSPIWSANAAVAAAGSAGIALGASPIWSANAAVAATRNSSMSGAAAWNTLPSGAGASSRSVS
mmetsp:Transcript_20911/g.47777  ORF Transcript_20911/g.47777 Transcript_20911/m.47777 type:complete len:204 (+) Transcript_20911:519-1130(+)